MAANLVGRGVDRVIAMLAPVTDGYATELARRLYQELAARPDLPVGQALANARILAEEDRSAAAGKRLPLPEYGVATLLTAGGDGPLVDPVVPEVPLVAATVPAGGRSVRELPVGALIGRRKQLRDVMGVLRRTPAAEREFGAASGVVLTGIGGIGKTALAGRVISRLREDRWLIAVHEGKWNPTSLITATAQATAETLPGITDPAQEALLRRAFGALTDQASDDGPKLKVVEALLERYRLLVVFDDFEQNLTPGGQDFLDPGAGEILTGLADAAQTGGLLVTCRYPLPGPDLFLAEVPIPGLSVAELRRMFLRLPALAELDPADQTLLIRAIGGHPRLIEFTDALLRGGVSSLRHVRTKLRGLAAAEKVDLSQRRPMDQAIDHAMVLGSADILLTELLALLTERQAAVLAQVAVCRAPMTLNDLAFALTVSRDQGDDSTSAETGEADLAALRTDAERLADLTLLSPGPDIAMHPWTAELATDRLGADPTALHERALAMRMRRFEQRRGNYHDLLDLPRHLAALRRYNDIAHVAGQAAGVLPGTLATLAYIAEIRPLIPLAERAWIIVADLEVQALLSAGDLRAAIRQFQAIHQQVENRAAADPANAGWQRDLSVSRNKLGDMAVAAGDLAGAREHFEAGLDIAVRLAAADPANTEWQRDLSVCHNRLGDVAVAAGDLAGAREQFQASLDIAAREHFQESLDIASRLVAADPANTGWQRDLSVNHNKLGEAAVAAGDLAGAREHFQASLDIRVRLAAVDPANVQWQRDLAYIERKIRELPDSGAEG
jgi:tetratricopeptide (TPR) repeat protein